MQLVSLRSDVEDGVLRRAIESVFDQRFPGQFELVIVDSDLSSSREIASMTGAIAGDTIRRLRLTDDVSVPLALNRGLIEARYSFIAILDPFGAWCDGKIERQFARFAADADLSVSAGGKRMLSSSGEVLRDELGPTSWADALRFHGNNGCPLHHGSVLARRNILLELGGYPHNGAFRHCEDYALWGTLLRFFKPDVIDDVVYTVANAPSPMTAGSKDDNPNSPAILRAISRRVGITSDLPSALEEFASTLGISMIDAGRVAFRIWRHGCAVRLPVAAIAPLRRILPDRDLDCVSTHVKLLSISQILGDVGAGPEMSDEMIVLARHA